MEERIKNEILKYFPMQIRECIIKNANYKLKDIREIRIRVNKPVILKNFSNDIVIDNVNIDKETIINEIKNNNNSNH